MEEAARKLVEWIDEQVRQGRARGMANAEIVAMVTRKVRQFHDRTARSASSVEGRNR